MSGARYSAETIAPTTFDRPRRFPPSVSHPARVYLVGQILGRSSSRQFRRCFATVLLPVAVSCRETEPKRTRDADMSAEDANIRRPFLSPYHFLLGGSALNVPHLALNTTSTFTVRRRMR